MTMKKNKVFSEKESALNELLAARDELDRVRELFNWANEEYFDLANSELTIAELRFNNAVKKIRLLCKDGQDIPQMCPFKYISVF